MPGDVEVVGASETKVVSKEEHFCDICGRAFTNSEYLRRHKRDRHREIIKEHLTCPKCGLELKNVSGLWSHILVKHEKAVGGVGMVKLDERKKFNNIPKKKRKTDVNETTGPDDDDNRDQGVLKTAVDTGADLTSNSWVYGNKCILCQKSFADVSGLRRHIKGVHSLDWKIIHADIEEAGGDQLIKKLEEDEKLSEHYCLVCNLEFVSLEGLIRHRKYVHDIIPEAELQKRLETIKDSFKEMLTFRCKDCGKRFQKLKKLDHHYVNFHLRTDFTSLSCSSCEIQFETTCGLSRHLKNIHGTGDPNLPEDYWHHRIQCNYCTQLIFYKDYKLHIQKAHNDIFLKLKDLFDKKDFSTGPLGTKSCDICERPFEDLQTLKRHMMRVHADRCSEFACSECGKEFKDSGALRGHLLTHQKLAIEPYVKDMLKEIFGVISHYKAKLICSLCGTETVNSMEARIHVYVMHPDKFQELITDKMMQVGNAGFPCGTCVQHFNTLEEAISHIEGNHPEVNVPTCKVCGHKELKERDMNSHYQLLHPDVSRYVCEICNATFPQGKMLQLHIKRDHTDEGVQCPYCPEKHVKVKLHVTKKHPERAEEYTQLLKNAIREECQARMEFNQLIDGTPPVIPKRIRKHMLGRKRKGRRTRKPLTEDEESESVGESESEDEDFISTADLCKVKIDDDLETAERPSRSHSTTQRPPPPPEPYKIDKNVDKHLIEIRRLTPPPQNEEEDDEAVGLEGEEEVDVKPSIEDLDFSKEEDNEDKEAISEHVEKSDKVAKVHVEKLTQADLDKWLSPKKTNPETDVINEEVAIDKEPELNNLNLSQRRRMKAK